MKLWLKFQKICQAMATASDKISDETIGIISKDQELLADMS